MFRKRPAQTPIALAFFFFAAGCGVSVAPDADNDADTLAPPNLAEPCLSAPCATKSEHLNIFDAENFAFSSDGRLFISGGENIFEITRNNDETLLATVISDDICNYTGLTIKGEVLYAACGDNRLFAANINNFPLSSIYAIGGSQLANGLTELDGRLYVTDGPLSFPSKIIQLDIDPNNDFAILSQQDWTDFGELNSANGIQAVGGEIWVTDFNQLKAYEVNENGQKAAVRTLLTHGAGAFDDFSVLNNGNIVLNDNVGNTSHLFDSNGNQLDSTMSVSGPSSAIQGRPPLFDASQILITEKGTLGDNTEGNGNRLAIFTAN